MTLFIDITGNSELVSVAKAALVSVGVIPVNDRTKTLAQFTVEINDIDGDTVVFDSVDSAIERELFKQVRALTGKVVTQDAGGNRETEKVVIGVPKTGDSGAAIVRAVLRALVDVPPNPEQLVRTIVHEHLDDLLAKSPALVWAVLRKALPFVWAAIKIRLGFVVFALLLATAASAQTSEVTVVQGGNTATVTAAGEVKVDCTTGCSGGSSNPTDTALPGTADTGVVVRPVPQVRLSGGVTLGALNATVSVALAGFRSAGGTISAGTCTCTIIPEASTDGGVTWESVTVLVEATQVGSIVLTNPNVDQNVEFFLAAAETDVRLRVSAYTSGSAVARLQATDIASSYAGAISTGPNGLQAPVFASLVGGIAGAGQLHSITVLNSAPAGTEYAQVVRNIPSGTQTVDGSGVTQPVSAASLPLPTGAATESTLSTLSGKVTTNTTLSDTTDSGVVVRAVPQERSSADVVLGALNDTVAVTTTGFQSYGGSFNACTCVLTLTFESRNATTGTWGTSAVVGPSGTQITSLALNNTSGGGFEFFPAAQFTEVRVRVSSYTSGSLTSRVRTSTAISASALGLSSGLNGVAAPFYRTVVGGTDAGGTTRSEVLSNTTPGGSDYAFEVRNIPSGTQTVSGTVGIDQTTPGTTNGVSVTNIPHVIADGGSTTTVTGNVTVVQPTAANLNMTEASAAAIKTDVDKIPSQGQALATASMPVVLPAASVLQVYVVPQVLKLPCNQLRRVNCR